MKKSILLCAACLLALTGCARGQAEVTPTVRPTATPQATPLVSATELPEPTPVVVATPQVTKTPEVLPTETVLQPTPTPEPEGWDGDPDKLTLDDFPTQLATAEDIATGESDLYLIAQLPESDTWLYGVYSIDKEQSMILRVGPNWKGLNGIFFSPQGIMPTMAYGDFDSDMDMELAIIPYLGGGTDASAYGLHVVEFGSTGWTVLTFQESDYRAIVEQSVLCSYDAATNVATLQLGETSLDLNLDDHGLKAVEGPVSSMSGDHIYFAVNGDTITGRFSVAIQVASSEGQARFPISLAYVDATVVYTGSNFGLADLILSPM